MKKPARKVSYKLLFYSLMAVAVLLFVLLSQKARASIIVSIFIFTNMVITSYKKFIRIPIEIEVLTLGIVLCTIEFGIEAGLVVAILGWILSFFVGLDISPYAIPMFLGYLSIVFVAQFLSFLPIAWVGVAATLVNNLIVFLIYHFALSYDPLKNLRYGLSNIVLNLILFFNIAPFLQQLIQ